MWNGGRLDTPPIIRPGSCVIYPLYRQKTRGVVVYSLGSKHTRLYYVTRYSDHVHDLTRHVVVYTTTDDMRVDPNEELFCLAHTEDYDSSMPAIQAARGAISEVSGVIWGVGSAINTITSTGTLTPWE